MADRRITFLAMLLAAMPVLAQASAVPTPAWTDPDRVTIPNSAHRKLVNRVPLRAASPDLAMERMQLVLKMAPEAAASLKQLLKDQQDPSSSRYHQWLSPEQFGRQFGPSQAQRDAASLWLLQQGFAIDATAKSGLAVTFSGTAGQVAKAFQTSIMEYDVNGVIHHGNASNISLPRSLAGFVSGVASLNDLRRQAQPRFRPLPGRRQDTSNGYTYIAPGDFATIYNLNPLFSNGITGQNVTIGIVGQTDIGTSGVSDWNSFRSTFGLTASGTLTVLDTTTPPGQVDPGDEGESELDTQWATAAAPGANLVLAVSPSSVTTGGINLSAQYLVDNEVAPIISLSYGECEADMGGVGSAQVTFWEQLWAQAAGQGISVFVAAGDSGAAGCDDPVEFTASGGLGVNGIGSTPFNTCVGGTEFNATGSTYWNATAAANGTTAIAYVPEGAWNESSLDNGFRLYAGGGGVSTCWSKPSWQSATGVPSDGMRDVPDVALNASAINFPSAVMVGGSLQAYGGTSVATPCMAGIMALVIQSQNGQKQGNANPTLYALGKAQYAQSGPSVFHDIGAGTANNNTVPGQIGYNCGTGYDLVTGLGSVNAQALALEWTKGSNPIQVVVSSPNSFITTAVGMPVSFAGTATDSTGATPTYLWSFGDGATTAASSGSHTYTAAGIYTATLTATDGLYAQTSSPIRVTIEANGVSPSITLPVTSSYAYPGVTINFTAAATSANAGATSAFTYAWDFGDGTGATGPSASHAFAENDSTYYQVTLTATDSTRASGQTSILLLSDSSYALDCNGDGSIDVRDLLTLAAAWNPVLATPANFNGLNVWGDLNADGMVSDADLQIWINHFAPVAQ